MRVPWLQVAMEVIEQAAPDLAAEWNCSIAEAGWGLISVFKWALGRCPDHEPPSANAVVRGPAAARLIAKAAGKIFERDPEAFVAVLARLSPSPVLELLPDGIRVCGLSRYDAFWGKGHLVEWRAWKLRAASGPATALPRAETGTEPALNRAEHGAEPGRQIKTQRTDPPPAGAHARESSASSTPGPEVTRPPPPAQPRRPDVEEPMPGFTEWADGEHHRVHPRALPTPPELAALFRVQREALAAGLTQDALRASWSGFLEDAHWSALNNPCPWAGWLKQWRDWLPGLKTPGTGPPRSDARGKGYDRAAGAHPDKSAPCSVCGKDGSGASVWGSWVGYCHLGPAYAAEPPLNSAAAVTTWIRQQKDQEAAP